MAISLPLTYSTRLSKGNTAVATTSFVSFQLMLNDDEQTRKTRTFDLCRGVIHIPPNWSMRADRGGIQLTGDYKQWLSIVFASLARPT